MLRSQQYVCTTNDEQSQVKKKKLKGKRRDIVAKDKEADKAKKKREREQKMKKQHVKKFNTKKKDAFDMLGNSSDDYLFKPKKKKNENRKNTYIYEQ